MRKLFMLFLVSVLLFSCKDIESIKDLSPNEDNVLTTGADLQRTLHQSHLDWWQAVHSPSPNLALLVAADAYGLSRGDFGTVELGMQPRSIFDNRLSAASAMRAITETPWYACLNSVSSANDVLIALEKGISIDQGNIQDQSIRAAAHFVRGLSWGYLGLVFYEGILVTEDTDLEKEVALVAYTEMIKAAVEELELAIDLVENIGSDFVHAYFNGLELSQEQFLELSHSYAARFLAQSPRTATENENVNWEAVFFHADQGLTFDFAPQADGKDWQSYQQYVFAETGKGPFWARVDQRIVATFDASQPSFYPEVIAKEAAPLNSKIASSEDARLESDFLFEERINFDAKKGEWHFSHYKHQRNASDPIFEGDGWSFGNMPVFLKADNDLLKAEAALRIGSNAIAISILNNSNRVTKANLPSIQNASTNTLEQIIFYERTIELLSTAPMGLWFDRRRLAAREGMEELSPLGGLQIGTPAHLPIPAKELITLGKENYTFGGARDLEGITPISL